MPSPPRRGPQQAVAAAWAVLPVRSFVVALTATLLVWGPFLLPGLTISPTSQARTVHPFCRVATPELECQTRYGMQEMVDPGAPAWQEAPADYFFRNARARGQPRPSWNPYVGSGSPIVLDGINASTSPTRWFLSHFPGDQGRDVLVFTRFLLWTFGIVWAVGLLGASSPLLAAVALAALFVSAMGFLQAQIVFCAVVALLALAAAPRTRGRSLVLAAGIASGEIVFSASWLPLVLNLDGFVSSRRVLCIIEVGQGAASFWQGLIRPPLTGFATATATLVGSWLVLLFGTRRWSFLVVTLAAIGAWIVLGLPHAACSLPLLSGARFVRHLVPHFEMLFIFGVATAAHAASEHLDRKRTWIAFAAAAATSFAIAAGVSEVFWLRVIGCLVIGVMLGIIAGLPWRTSAVHATARRAAFETGLVLFAFMPYFFGSPISDSLWVGRAGAPQVAPLPVNIDSSTPLGTVQSLARTEDRRHFSPGGLLYPNWSAALDIPDLLSVGALYPIGYHELNAALFPWWERDPQHGLVPDRFVPPPPSATMSPEFQRVMAVHRVSLLTFIAGKAFFAAAPSPYERTRCRLLSRSLSAAAESWVCPEVGGIGYFPELIQVVHSRLEALTILQGASPSEIVRLGVLGPELDLAVPTEAGAGHVLSVERQGDDLAYVLDVERAGVFVIADTWFRGWHATVNGAPVPISRANVAFKAVRVPTGRVELHLHFSPET